MPNPMMIPHPLDSSPIQPHQVGLRRLAFKFAAEDITPEMLRYLDDNTMRDLGVSSVGARLRLRMLAGTVRPQQ